MNNAGGFIALHRKILEWGWYKSSGTKDLFLHLLLTANFTDTKFHGRTIKRGQIVTSLPSISTETGLSVQQVRTAIRHLVSTGEITDESCNHYRIITVIKYDDYQTLTDRSTGNQQATNRQHNRQSTDSATGNQQHHNNYNNNNKGTNEQGNHDSLSRSDFSEREAFDSFWAAYPKKVAKTNAMKAWVKLMPDEDTVEKIMSGLYVWKHSEEWTRDDGRFIPHPATWLNGRRWEDEVPKITTRKPVAPSLPSQDYHQRDYSDAQENAFERMMRLGGEDL